MRSLVLGGVIASVLAGAVPASAAVVSAIDLSFTGTGISGALDLTYVPGTSPFTVDGVSGSVNVGGTTYTVTGLTTYAGDDQALYSPSSSVGYVDFPGISVSLSDGDALNLFAFNPTSYGVLLRSQNAVGDPYPGSYYAVSVSDPPLVPEPTTWAMMLLGFAGLGLVAKRRRKTPIAAVV